MSKLVMAARLPAPPGPGKSMAIAIPKQRTRNHRPTKAVTSVPKATRKQTKKLEEQLVLAREELSERLRTAHSSTKHGLLRRSRYQQVLSTS